MYRFRALASVVPGSPVCDPCTHKTFVGLSTESSTAVSVTVPVLHFESAGIVSFRFLAQREVVCRRRVPRHHPHRHLVLRRVAEPRAHALVLGEIVPGEGLMATIGMQGSSIVTVAVDGVPMRTPLGAVPKPIVTPSPSSPYRRPGGRSAGTRLSGSVRIAPKPKRRRPRRREWRRPPSPASAVRPAAPRSPGRTCRRGRSSARRSGRC